MFYVLNSGKELIYIRPVGTVPNPSNEKCNDVKLLIHTLYCIDIRFFISYNSSKMDKLFD